MQDSHNLLFLECFGFPTNYRSKNTPYTYYLFCYRTLHSADIGNIGKWTTQITKLN